MMIKSELVAHAEQESSAVTVCANDGLVALLSFILEVALVDGLEVSLALCVEQVVGLEEERDAVVELLLCAEVESEHRLVPLVGVLERRHKCEFRAGERDCKLCVPTMFGVLVEQGEIGCVRRLVHERTSLRNARLILCAAFLVLALRSGNLRVGVGIVCLHTKVAYVLYHVYLEAHVLRVAQVGGHVVGVCSGTDFAVRRNEHLFYRVLQILTLIPQHYNLTLFISS